MSIQGHFNEYTIDQLALVRAMIDKAEKFEANQMRFVTLQKIGNCTPALSDMTSKQVNDLENELINEFKYHGWVSKK